MTSFFTKPSSDLLFVFLHTAAIYLFLMTVLRLIGRRQMGQLTVVDLVIIILLGSAVETAMVNGNTNLDAGLVASATLFLLNRLFASIFARHRRLRHITLSGPLLLVHNGHFVESHLRQAGLTHADVMEAIREREQPNLAHIRFAVLEMDGEINVVPLGAKTHRSKKAAAASSAPPAPES